LALSSCVLLKLPLLCLIFFSELQWFDSFYSPLHYNLSWKSLRLFSNCLACIDLLTDRLTNRSSAGMQTHVRTKQILIYFVYIFLLLDSLNVYRLIVNKLCEFIFGKRDDFVILSNSGLFNERAQRERVACLLCLCMRNKKHLYDTLINVDLNCNSCFKGLCVRVCVCACACI